MHVLNSYRFMVIERLGEDLQTIFERKGRRFNKETVLQIGVRMVCVDSCNSAKRDSWLNIEFNPFNSRMVLNSVLSLTVQCRKRVLSLTWQVLVQSGLDCCPKEEIHSILQQTSASQIVRNQESTSSDPFC